MHVKSLSAIVDLKTDNLVGKAVAHLDAPESAPDLMNLANGLLALGRLQNEVPLLNTLAGNVVLRTAESSNTLVAEVNVQRDDLAKFIRMAIATQGHHFDYATTGSDRTAMEQARRQADAARRQADLARRQAELARRQAELVRKQAELEADRAKLEKSLRDMNAFVNELSTTGSEGVRGRLRHVGHGEGFVRAPNGSMTVQPPPRPPQPPQSPEPPQPPGNEQETTSALPAVPATPAIPAPASSPKTY
jgi:hypothetical protein